MVTSPHETSHRIFQDRPELLPPVFEILGVPLPRKATVEVISPDATEIRPLERRVDSVLRVEPPDGDGFLLAIEAQGRKDREKASSWTYYLGYLGAKYDLPVLLLVVCKDRATARWAAGPFRGGYGTWTSIVIHPLVLGPDNVPVITDAAEASRNLAMTAFSAMTHGTHQQAPAILEALAQALGTADQASFKYYSEIMEIGLGNTPARDTWRKLMAVGTYFPGRGTLVEETFLEGKAEGKAESILAVLAARGIDVPEDDARRIAECTDTRTLDLWLQRAVTAASAAEVF
ncbi:hypothetical protein RGF97_13650 [Streptomyces roseicoloratus]|uniref:DUF4365 domain-containing protein n=1 Tax=Streptomyces roseicoloratus TaxID=2508722 RepID=A0ABY9RU16_9ACTN|nr:hypothetical protein [Streptomyces roseicoloratus]WMX45687.1 hypothetical protein RGF97_13650 [Streptomyces roseicoloratus]